MKLLAQIAVALYFLGIVVFDNELLSGYIIYAASLIAAIAFAVLLLNKWIPEWDLFLAAYSSFVLYIMMSVLWSPAGDIAIERAITIVLVFVSIVALMLLARSTNILLASWFGLIIGCFINIALFFGLIVLPIDVWDQNRFTGTVNNPNLLGRVGLMTLMVTVMLVGFNRNHSAILAALGLAAGIITVILSGSRLSLVICLLLIALALVSFRDRRLWILILSSAGGIATIFILFATPILMEQWDRLSRRSEIGISYFANEARDNSIESRKSLIVNGIDLFLDSPVIGNGVGAFEDNYGAYAHNNTMDILANFGALGFVLYSLLYFGILRRLRRNCSKHIALTGYGLLFLFFMSEQGSVTYTSKTLFLTWFLFWVYSNPRYTTRNSR